MRKPTTSLNSSGRLAVVLVLLVPAAVVPVWPQDVSGDRAALAAAAGRDLQSALRSYEGLVSELDLRDVPPTIRGYASVTGRLDELGEELENLSRQVLQAEQLAPDEFAQLQTDIGQLAVDLQALRREAFPLRVWAYLHNHGYRRPGWGLGLADPLTLSPPVPQAAAGEVGTTLELWAARGEAESGQLLVVSFGNDLPAVAASCRPLRGRTGTIPASSVQCQAVEYLADAPDGSPWPEILLPPGPVDVPGDSLRALWVTVSVPPSQPAGVYEGELAIKPTGMSAIRVSLRVHVWNLPLPLPRSLACSVPVPPATEGTEATALLATFGLTPASGSNSPQQPAATVAAGQSLVGARLLGWQAWAAGQSRIRLEMDETASLLLRVRPTGQLAASLMLTALRDALDDYEYLRLAEQREKDSPALAELLGEARKLAQGPGDETAAAKLLQLRQRIGDVLGSPDGTE